MNVIGFLSLTIYFILVNILIYYILEKASYSKSKFKYILILLTMLNLYWLIDLFFESHIFLLLNIFSCSIFFFHFGYYMFLVILTKKGLANSFLFKFILILKSKGIYLFIFFIQIFILINYFFY